MSPPSLGRVVVTGQLGLAIGAAELNSARVFNMYSYLLLLVIELNTGYLPG
jgi:hypothetical protein